MCPAPARRRPRPSPGRRQTWPVVVTGSARGQSLVSPGSPPPMVMLSAKYSPNYSVVVCQWCLLLGDRGPSPLLAVCASTIARHQRRVGGRASGGSPSPGHGPRPPRHGHLLSQRRPPPHRQPPPGDLGAHHAPSPTASPVPSVALAKWPSAHPTFQAGPHPHCLLRVTPPPRHRAFHRPHRRYVHSQSAPSSTAVAK